MIKSFEELGEVLAEWENRVSTLENSGHSHEPEREPETQTIVRGLTRQERDEFNQLKSKMLWLQNKANERFDKKKPAADIPI